MRHTLCSTLAMLVAVALGQSSCLAAESARAETFDVGTLLVQQHGDHGSPLILIPGLACGAWVWDDTVAHLQKDHVLYVVTLAGFDGTKPVKGNLIDLANDSLLQLIKDRHIEKPILIGHSLGGTLSIQFAEHHSDLIAGVIAVDGLPIFPGFDKIPAARRAATIKMMRDDLAKSTHDQFAEQELAYMKTTGVMDETKAAELTKYAARSDPAATGEYLAEDLSLDLRPGLAGIKIPLLEISPYNAADFAKGMPFSEDQKTAMYRSLLEGAPHAEVLSISPARHFVMYDQPAAFEKAVDKFIEKSGK